MPQHKPSKNRHWTSPTPALALAGCYLLLQVESWLPVLFWAEDTEPH
jgi:hypothetical protein